MFKKNQTPNSATLPQTPPKGLLWIPSIEPKEGKHVLILGWIECDISGICFRALKPDEQFILDKKTDLNYGAPLKKPSEADIYKPFNKMNFNDGIYWFLSMDGNISLSILKHDHDNTPFFEYVDLESYGMIWDPDSVTHYVELITPRWKP